MRAPYLLIACAAFFNIARKIESQSESQNHCKMYPADLFCSFVT